MSHEGMDHAQLNKRQRSKLVVYRAKGGLLYLADPAGTAVFDNNPVTTISMLKRGLDVFIPPIYFKKGGINRNPAIEYETIPNPNFNSKRKPSEKNPKSLFRVTDVLYPDTEHPTIKISQLDSSSDAAAISEYSQKSSRIVEALTPPSADLATLESNKEKIERLKANRQQQPEVPESDSKILFDPETAQPKDRKHGELEGVREVAFGSFLNPAGGIFQMSKVEGRWVDGEGTDLGKTKKEAFEVLRKKAKKAFKAPSKTKRKKASKKAKDNADQEIARLEEENEQIRQNLLNFAQSVTLGSEKEMILFDKEEDYDLNKALDILATHFNYKNYLSIVEREGSGALPALVVKALEIVGNAEAPTSARANALGEAYYDMARTLKLMLIKADMDREGMLTVKNGKLVFKESAEDLDVEPLLKYFTIAENEVFPNPHSAQPLPANTASERLAGFLYTYMGVFPVQETTKINVVGPKGRPIAELVPNWDKIVIKAYFEKEFAHQRFQPNPRDGSFPNFYGAVSRAGSRGRNSLGRYNSISINEKLATGDKRKGGQFSWDEAFPSEAGALIQQERQGDEGVTGQSEIEEAVSVEEQIGEGQHDTSDVNREAQVIGLSVNRLKTLARKEAEAKQTTLIDTLIGLSQAAGIKIDSTPTFTELIQVLLKRIQTLHNRGLDRPISDIRAEMGRRNIPRDLSHLLNLVGLPPLDPRVGEGNRMLSALRHFKHDAPSIVGHKKAEWARRKNRREIERLGLESGDPATVIAALEQIAASSRNRKHRDVARLILKDPDLINAIDFVIVDNADGSAGHFKLMPDGQMEVAINLSGFYGQGVESVLLHEFLHAVTANNLFLKPEADLTETQLRAKRRLEKLMTTARESGESGIEFDHATENLSEFISTFFSSSSFQRSLRRISYGADKPSFFRRILDSIMDFLGIRDKRFRESFDDLTNFVTIGNASDQTTGFGLLDTIISQAKGRSRGVRKHTFLEPNLQSGPVRGSSVPNPLRPFFALAEPDELDRDVGVVKIADRTISFEDDPSLKFLLGGHEPIVIRDLDLLPNEQVRYTLNVPLSKLGYTGTEAKYNVEVDIGHSSTATGFAQDVIEIHDIRAPKGVGGVMPQVLGAITKIADANRIGITLTDALAPGKTKLYKTYGFNRYLAPDSRNPDMFNEPEEFIQQVLDALNFDIDTQMPNAYGHNDYFKRKEDLDDIDRMGTITPSEEYGGDVVRINHDLSEGREEAMYRGYNDDVLREIAKRFTDWQRIVETKEFALYRPPSQRDALFSSFEALSSDVVATPQEEAQMDALIDEAIQYLVPASVPVSVVDSTEGVEAFEGRPNAALVAVLLEKDGVTMPAIFINRSNLRNGLLSRSSLVRNSMHAKAVLKALIDEELTHVAEFNTLPQAELDAVVDVLGDEDWFSIIDEYTAGAPEGSTLRQDLRAKVEAGDVETLRQLMGEKFRMMTQRIQNGSTTEEDIIFYQSDPNLFQLFLRYFTNVFRKMMAKRNLRKQDPEIAAIVNRMAASMEFLANGGTAQMTKLPFDPRSPEEGYNVLARRFAAQHDDIDENTSYEATLQQYSGLFQTLELPVALFRDGGFYGAGEYKGFKGFKAFFAGNTDPRVTELKKMERAFFSAIEKTANDSLSRFEELKAKFPEIDNTLISQATGSTSDAAVTSEFRKERLAEWHAWCKKKRKEAKDTESRKRYAEVRKLKWNELVERPIREEKARQTAVIKKDISQALDSIRKISPEMAEVLMEVRNFVDALSYKLKEVYGTDETLSAKFDSQFGIYLTRAYRAFNEEGYVENILKDTNSKAYQEGYKFFRRKWISAEARRLRKKEDLTIKEARERAARYLDEQPLPTNPATAAMRSYLYAMDARANGKAFKLPDGVAKSLLGNLRERTQVPPELRALLGEYTPEEGIQNIFRTMTVVSRMLSKQAFYNNLIEAGAIDTGQPERKGFLMTHEQMANRINTYGESDLTGWVNLRTGVTYDPNSEVVALDALESEYDKSYHYYAPPEMVEDMKAMFSSSVENEYYTTGDKAVSGIVSAARVLTGYSLSSKTMGSLGFYLRNILGNLLFFGPAQGLSIPALYKVMSNNLGREIKTALTTPDAFDAYHAELVSLNLIGTDLYASQVRDLLKDGEGILSLEREISQLHKFLKKAKKLGDKVNVSALTKRLVAATQAADAFYKIGYFEHELSILKEAKKYDVDRGTNTGYGHLSEYEMKVMAAKKVRRTAQSYSDTWHGIEKLTQNIGIVLTPFLRFKTEVLRVTGETHSLSKEERASQNPVIQARGRQRRRGLYKTLGIWSTLFPIALRAFFGVGEEEDEAIREAGPEYKRLNTFYYTRGMFGLGKVGGDELYSWDATFLNPFAVTTDPVLRFLEGTMRGDPVDGTIRGLSHLFTTYAGEQIFTSAVLDWSRNRRADNGQPIYEKNEGFLNIAGKSLGYVFEEAFAPRTPSKMLKAAQGVISDTATDHTLKPAYMLLTEVMPIKPYKHDMKLTFRRFLEKKRDERNRATARLNVLKSRGGLTEGKMRRATRYWLNTRKRIDEEIYRTWLGLSSLGEWGLKTNPRDRLTREEALSIMSIPALGMGKRRQERILNGRMDRPMLTKPFIEGVQRLTPDGRVGAQRIRVAEDEILKFGPSEIILDPTD